MALALARAISTLALTLTITLAHAQAVPVGQLLGPVPVTSILDGDTLVVESNVGPRTVRLIGVDAPESGAGGPAGESMGKVATGFLTSLLPPRTQVWLELDLATDDIYGRLLAYVYVGDPRGDWVIAGRPARQVNLAVVEAGIASVMTIAPNDVYADLYAAANSRARAAGRGMYGAAADPASGTPLVATARVPRDAALGNALGIALHCALYNPDTPNDEDGEWVSVMIAEPLDTRGYYLHDRGSGSDFRLPAGVQLPGELRVSNPDQGVWNNSGDVIYLMRGGETVDAWEYSGQRSDQGRVVCRDG